MKQAIGNVVDKENLVLLLDMRTEMRNRSGFIWIALTSGGVNLYTVISDWAMVK